MFYKFNDHGVGIYIQSYIFYCRIEVFRVKTAHYKILNYVFGTKITPQQVTEDCHLVIETRVEVLIYVV